LPRLSLLAHSLPEGVKAPGFHVLLNLAAPRFCSVLLNPLNQAFQFTRRQFSNGGLELLGTRQ